MHTGIGARFIPPYKGKTVADIKGDDKQSDGNCVKCLWSPPSELHHLWRLELTSFVTVTLC